MSAIRRGDTIAARMFGPFAADRVDAYAGASLDDNPLHVDPAVAARAGLPRPPIHGMLIMGCFEPYLADWRPEAVIVKVAGKFIKPVLVGDTIEIAGKVVQAVEGEAAVLRLMVKGGSGDLACLAEAFVRS